MEKVYFVKGLHCHSCELHLEGKVKEVEGVKNAKASFKKGVLFVRGDFVDSGIVAAIRESGYDLSGTQKGHLAGVKLKEWLSAIFITAALIVASNFIGFDRLIDVAIPSKADLPVIFLVGMTAGVSSCMALVGGLVLSLSTSYVEKHQSLTFLQKFRPHLFFNFGRILGYAFLGGLLGAIGGIIKLNSSFSGFLMIIVGFVIIVMALNILNIAPKLVSSLVMPKRFGLYINKKNKGEYSHAKATLLGALTFLLPCGITQAVQILALASGDLFSGGLIMGTFALGTAPGLLSVGGLSALIRKGKYRGVFTKAVGLFLLVLAVYNISNGLRLVHPRVNFEKPTTGSFTLIPSEEPIVLKSTYTQSEVLTPRNFTVKVGQPVRMEIFAKEDGLGCMGSIMIPGLSDNPQFFAAGQTIIMEFVPKKTGKFYITCAMGVPAGELLVEK